MLLDASQSYTMAPGPAFVAGSEAWAPPARVKSLTPDARLVYIVRDPADRFVSHYWHERRAGREDRPIEAAIDDPRYYFFASFAFAQIRLWLDHFPREQFLFLRFDETAADPAAAAIRCAAFLGVDPDAGEFNPDGARNASYAARPWARRILAAANTNTKVQKLANAVKDRLPAQALERVKSAMTEEIAPPTPETLERLRDLFVHDKEKMDALFDEAL